MFELLLLILGAVFVKKQILDKPQAFTPAPRPVLRPNPRPVPVNRGGFLPSPQPVAPPSPIPQYQPWQAPTPAPEQVLTAPEQVKSCLKGQTWGCQQVLPVRAGCGCKSCNVPPFTEWGCSTPGPNDMRCGCRQPGAI